MRVIVAPFVPLDVHTDGVVVVNATGRPELAVALTVTGDWLNLRFTSAPNEIVWLAFVAVTLANTSVAAV
jgi:hypothetical protein